MRKLFGISAALLMATTLSSCEEGTKGGDNPNPSGGWKPSGKWGVVTYYADGAVMSNMSPNGQFIIGCVSQEFARVVNLDGIIENHDPGDVDEFGNMVKYRFRDEAHDPKSYTQALFPASVLDGVWVMQGINNEGVPQTQTVTSDGKTTISYVGAALNGGFIPVVKGPDGDAFPEIPVTFSQFPPSQFYGCTADAISANGKTVVGRAMATGERRVTVYWQQDEAGKWKIHQSAPDQLEWGVTNEATGIQGLAKFPSSNPGGGVSPDGRYIYGEIRQGHFITGPYRPYYFDIETQTTTIIPIPEGTSGRTTAISPDGTVFYFYVPVVDDPSTEGVDEGNGGEGATQYRVPMVWRNGASMTLQAYLLEKSGGTLDIEADGTAVHGFVTCAADTHLVWCDMRADAIINYFAMPVPEK